MKIKAVSLVLVLAVLVVGLSGCHKAKKKDYNKQLPPGELALRKITDPNQIPDFTAACMDTARLGEAVSRSISYLSKPSSKAFFPYGEITHEQAKTSLIAFEGMLQSGMTAEQMNQELRTKFDVWISVGCDDMGTVLYTGYYTPIFNGSMTRTDVYKYPLYKQPSDLVKGPNGEILGQKMADGSIRQYPSRQEIMASNKMAGNELVWLSDPFEVYITHVQGSAKIRTPDGKLQTFGYAANNGWEYNSPNQNLIASGKITAESLSLQTLIDYFKAHPQEVDAYVAENPRFVFFRPESGEPRGSLNEPVTPFRSIATDKTIYPRGSLTFISADLGYPVGFALDQDTGGAIRAAGRCDVYTGTGDSAAMLAGKTYTEGKLYYLFLKPGAGIGNVMPMEK
jgi:membrane-bound lytic murein transglycosylase A